MPGSMFFSIAHNPGGAEVSLLELARHWPGGLKVVCPGESAFSKRLERARVRTAGIRVPALKGGGGLFAKLTNYTYAQRARNELERVFNAGGDEVFVTNNLMADFFAGDIPTRFKRRTACYCRDKAGGEVRAKFLATRDLILAPSQWIEDDLRRAGFDRIARVPVGVDVEYFTAAPPRAAARAALSLPTNRRIIGYAGQFIRRKGLLTFITIAEKLAARHADLLFVIAGGDLYGDSPFTGEVRGRIKASAYSDRFVLPGMLTDIRPFYAALDLFVTLALEEPFGRTPIEAALCGTLPLAAADGGYKETVGDVPALLLSPTDENSTVEAIDELLAGRGNPAALLVSMRAVARRYTVQNTVARLQEALAPLGA
ncbi:MAG: glycosyltransferase family 4 protein [Planctomycetota bacterium]